MGVIVRDGSENLTGGMITSKAPHQVGLNESIDTQNIDPRDQRGVTTRNGHTRISQLDIGSAVSSTVNCNGLKAWTANAGTNYILAGICRSAASAGVAYRFWEVGTTPSSITWASYSNSYWYSPGFKAEPLTDILVLCHENSNVKKWVAGATAVADLGGSPPAGSKYCAVYISKLFLAGRSASPQTLTWSASNSPEDFTTADNAGSVVIRSGGGDKIKGMASNKRVLLVFFGSALYALYGASTPEFRVEKLYDRGLVSENGHVSIDEVTFFASNDAIYMVAGTRISDISTLKFKETYAAISDKSRITLGALGKLLVVMDYSNNKCYVCDYTRNVWAEWTNQKWQVMDTTVDGYLYAGEGGASSASGVTGFYRLDYGSNDYGSVAITAYWRTPNLTFGWPDAPKNLNCVKVHAKPGIATVTVTYYKNGTSTGSTNDLSFASTGDHSLDGVHGQSAVRGLLLGLKFSWSGIGTLYGWTAYAEICADKGQIPTEM